MMRHPMSRRAIAIGSAVLGASACAKQAKQPPNAPVPVVVARVTRATVPYDISANGTATPVRTAQVQAQVQGIILKVLFQEGDEVREGQILFQLDPQPYRATLLQAKATLARDQATAESAARDAERYASLVAKDYVTKEQVDQLTATARAAAATVKADSAAVETAQINLGYTAVRAPIAGRTGSLLVREGNLVRATAAQSLVSINQIRPMLVQFAVPSTLLPTIQKYNTPGANLPVTVVPGTIPSGTSPQTGPTPMSALDPSTGDVPAPQGVGPDTSGTRPGAGRRVGRAPTDSQTVRPVPNAIISQGALTFVDNTVDTATGTVLLKGTFPNTSGALWPGQFVATTLQLYTQPDAIVVPATAVMIGQQGTYVYVVDNTGTAHQRPVVVDRTVGQRAVIASGVREGEQVVTDGQSRLTPNAKVSVKSVA